MTRHRELGVEEPEPRIRNRASKPKFQTRDCHPERSESLIISRLSTNAKQRCFAPLNVTRGEARVLFEFFGLFGIYVL
jgi:hypothetical protein